MPSTSNNHFGIFILALFLLGAILFVVGTLLRRETAPPLALAEAPSPEAELDLELRIDRVERLAIVGQPWCVEELNEIRSDDPDATVREAADAALLVIAARAPLSF